jgi:hypothetical protein
VHHLGVFELDGNAVDTTPDVPCTETDGLDWTTVNFALPNSDCEADPIGTNADNIFTQGGSKDINDLTQWLWTLGNVPDKDDLLRVGVYTDVVPLSCEEPGINDAGDKLIYFFADRSANNGDAQLGFWFFQNGVFLDNSTNPGTFVDELGNPATHVDGDLLILAHFVNGGAATELDLFKWQLGANPDNLVVVTPPFLNCTNTGQDQVCLQANPDNIGGCVNTVAPLLCSTVPYTPKFPGNCPPTGIYPNVSFFEGGINLTKLLPEVCCFSSFIAETRSSQSLDAQLKDLVLGQIDTCDLEITQVCSDGCVGGTGITFSGTVTNSGFTTLTNVVVTNTACGNVNIGTLTPGQSAPWSCVANCTTGGDITNTATASGDPGVGCPSNVVSAPSEATCTCGAASLTVTETCADGCVGGVGIRFSGTVTNTGTVVLTNVNVTGTQCNSGSLGSLNPGQSVAWACTVTCAAGGDVTNDVTAHGTASAPCTGTVNSNTASATCTCETASLTVTETCADGCVGGVGIRFSGTVTNTGTVALTNVNVTGDQCNSGSLGTLNPGQSVAWACTVACAAGGDVTNNVTAHGTAASPCAGTVNSNTASSTCTCETASIAVTETCADGCVNGVGIRFSGTVTNTGTVVLTNVNVTGTACNSGSLGSLNPGQSVAWACTVACAAGGDTTNVVTAHGTASAPCTGTVNSSTASSTCTCESASIAVTETCADGCVGGVGIRFSGTVTNTGTVVLTNVNVTGDQCNSGSLGSLNPGQSVAWACTVACASGGDITNVVTAHGTAAAPCTGTVNSSTASSTCTCETASLTVTETCADGCVGGLGIRFSGTVTNTGSVVLTNVNVTGSQCNSGSLGSLNPGQSVAWACTVACTTGGDITNTVTAHGTAASPCAGTVNSNTTSSTCTCEGAGLSITETCADGCVGGVGIRFSGTVTNTGTVPVTGITVTGSACSPSAIGTLNPGQSAGWACTVACAAGGDVTNNVTANGTAGGACGGGAVTSNTAGSTCTCETASIAVTETCADGCVGGTGVVFSGTVTNTGTVVLTNVNVTGTQCNSGSLGSLNPGQSVAWSCTVACAAGGDVTNVVTAHGTASAPCAGTVNSSTASSTCTCRVASIAVTETCADGCTGGAGILFSGTVTNTGNVVLANVNVTGDQCNSGSLGSLNPGQSVAWSCTVACATGGDVTNVVTAHGTASGVCAGTVNSSTASSTCTCEVVCLSISEVCSPPSPCGAPIIFSGTVTNCGTVAIDNVVVNGSLCSPAAIGTLAPGASAAWSCNFLGPVGPNTNTVTASGNPASPCSGTTTSDPASATCTIEVCGEGCTPGYWRNHTSRWDSPSDPIAAAAGFTTSTSFWTFFNLAPGTCGLPTNLTMGQAVQLGGGGAFKLARHGVAGLLNYAAGINYSVPGTTISSGAELRDAIRNAFLNNCTTEPLATQIAAGNEVGTCPLN